MNDVYIKFKGDGREGTVAVGSYLIDAARRMGVAVECEAVPEDPVHSCVLKICEGGGLLSSLTALETEQLSAKERKDQQRLACQAKIEKPGEIEVMTVKNKTAEEKAKEEKNGTEEFKKEFADLPLDKKIASLVELEVMALGEAFSFVMNSPYEAVGKVMEVMAGFGHEKDKQDKEAKVPDEHKKAESGAADKKDKNGAATAKGSASSKTPATKAKTRKRKPRKKAEEESDKP